MTKEKTNLLIINRLRSKGYDTDNMDFTIVNDFVDIIYKEQLILSGVSGMFSEEQMEEAWTNGCGCGETRSGYFDIENYS